MEEHRTHIPALEALIDEIDAWTETAGKPWVRTVMLTAAIDELARHIDNEDVRETIYGATRTWLENTSRS